MSPCVLSQKEQKSTVSHPALKLLIQLIHLLRGLVKTENRLYSPFDCFHHIHELLFLAFQDFERSQRVRWLNDALARSVILWTGLGLSRSCRLLRVIGSLGAWWALSPILSISGRRVLLVRSCNLRAGGVGSRYWNIVALSVLLLSLIDLFDQIIFNL